MTLTELLITAIAGFGAGGLAGMFGVGGGFLLVPLLTAFLDLPAAVIVGSAGCAVLGPATTSLLARRTQAEDWRLPAVLFGGLMTGVVIGARFIDQLEELAPNFVERGVLASYGVLLIALGTWTAIDVWLSTNEKRLPRGWLRMTRVRPTMEIQSEASQSTTKISIPIATIAAVIVGALCGFLGMSGGLVTVPLFLFGFGLRMRSAIRSSLVAVWLVSLQSTIVHAWLDHISLQIVVCLLIGGAIGAQLATVWSRRLAPIFLRAGFSGLLLSCAAFVFIRLALAE